MASRHRRWRIPNPAAVHRALGEAGGMASDDVETPRMTHSGRFTGFGTNQKGKCRAPLDCRALLHTDDKYEGEARDKDKHENINTNRKDTQKNKVTLRMVPG